MNEIPQSYSQRINSRTNNDLTKRNRKTKNLSQEQLALVLKKKAECNAKAQKVVERLIDPIDDEESFLEMMKIINQEHYQDIVEERAISKLCGYPLCSGKIEMTFNQQYHISTNSNKVYDLSERKNFCSGNCLRYSDYLKSQLLTSPLWLRDTVIIPEFKLMKNK